VWMCVILRLWVNVAVKAVAVVGLQAGRWLVNKLPLVVRLVVRQCGSRLRWRRRGVVAGTGTCTGMVPVGKRRCRARDWMRARVRGAFGCENATEDKTEAEDVRIVVRVVI
jgi:hypothetical protein